MKRLSGSQVLSKTAAIRLQVWMGFGAVSNAFAIGYSLRSPGSLA